MREETGMKTVFISIICSVVTGSVVFGFTMADIVGPTREQLKVTATQINYLQTADTEQRSMIAADRLEFGARLSSLANLIAEQSKMNGELITLLKLQNQINNQK